MNGIPTLFGLIPAPETFQMRSSSEGERTTPLIMRCISMSLIASVFPTPPELMWMVTFPSGWLPMT